MAAGGCGDGLVGAWVASSQSQLNKAMESIAFLNSKEPSFDRTYGMLAADADQKSARSGLTAARSVGGLAGLHGPEPGHERTQMAAMASELSKNAFTLGFFDRHR